MDRKDLDLTNELLDCYVNELSDGELQRLAIARTVLQMADVYIFDEASSFLNARQTYRAAQVIRSVVKHDKYDYIIFLISSY